MACGDQIEGAGSLLEFTLAAQGDTQSPGRQFGLEGRILTFATSFQREMILGNGLGPVTGGIEQVCVFDGEKKVSGILVRDSADQFQRLVIALLAAQKEAERQGRVVARRAVRAADFAQVVESLLAVAGDSR